MLEEKKDEEEDNDDEIHIPLPPSGQVEYEEQVVNTDDLYDVMPNIV